MNKTVNLLRQTTEEEPKRILDVACGGGWLVKELSSAYPQSKVYGMDISWMPLRDGLKQGNFQGAISVQGDAYDLGKRKPKFRLVNLNSHNDRDATEVTFENLNKPLKNFDLVTTVNPTFELSAEDVNKLIRNESLGKRRGFVPVEVIARPAKKNGRVLYETEIAHFTAGLYGGLTPRTLTGEAVERDLDRLKKEGEKTDLSYVSHALIEKTGGYVRFPVSTDLAVLFKKV